MSKIENMKRENGYFEKDGKEYILTQQAYLDGVEPGYYTAMAICAEDKADEDGWQKSYRVKWDILGNYVPEDMEEDMACDWDEPEDVEESASEYNLEQDRFC